MDDQIKLAGSECVPTDSVALSAASSVNGLLSDIPTCLVGYEVVK